MAGQTEVKIVFSGPPGAGKTTAIKTISQIAVVSTEAKASDDLALRKETTTVGMDYGEIEIDAGLVLRLYGTPGQARFRHMWEILAKGALGFVILADNSRPQPFSDLAIYLDNFKSYIEQSAAVIGVTQVDVSAEPRIEDYYQFLRGRGEMYPVLTADPRRKEDVLKLLDTLFTNLELR
ncbi:MAG: ATP/GTP-binding protein [Gammaproteobacteria bacterium]